MQILRIKYIGEHPKVDVAKFSFLLLLVDAVLEGIYQFLDFHSQFSLHIMYGGSAGLLRFQKLPSTLVPAAAD